MTSVIRLRLLLLLGLSFIVTALWLVELFPNDGQWANLVGTDSESLLTVAFLNVGQGDSIYIETPDGKQMLIDGGPDGAVLRELPRQMPLFDKTIDIVLATHSDKDHIGGLVDVLKRYQVTSVVTTENKNDTTVSEAFNSAVTSEGAEIVIAHAGEQYELGASTTLLILSPQGDSTNWETNTASIVALLQYGDIEFVLTGDAPVNIEEYIAKSYGELIEAEVLKLGHHGSRTSTADLFLDTIKPNFAIVSAGLNNSYGHPHEEVIAKLEARNIKILNTANEGTIVFKSDGEKVWVE